MTMPGGPPRYFGEPWPSGICTEGVRVPTPVGELCLDCGEAIEEEHQGTFMGVLGAGHNVTHRPIHRECSLRSVLGGVAHLERRCSCYGGSDHDEDTMTRRESALAAWDWVSRRGFPDDSTQALLRSHKRGDNGE